MPWLLRDDVVLAAIDLSSRGLGGLADVDGAILIEPARAVHTIGAQFAVDVAYCRRRPEGGLEVLATKGMSRWRVARPRPRAGCVIAAPRGAFARWGLAPGDLLTVQ